MKNSTTLFESYLEVYNDCHVDEKWYKAGDPKYKVNMHGDKVGGGKDRRTSLEPELRKASPFNPEFTRRRLRVNDKKIDPYYEGSRKKRKANREAAGGKTYSEEYDIFDIIRDYLLDEGYAETPEAANAIMVNMSEEWREDILEANALDVGKDSLTKNIDRQYRSKPLRKTSSGQFLRRGVKIRGAKDYEPRNPRHGKYYDMQSKKRVGVDYKYLAKLDHTQD